MPKPKEKPRDNKEKEAKNVEIGRKNGRKRKKAKREGGTAL
jgi:hypothetical protein